MERNRGKNSASAAFLSPAIVPILLTYNCAEFNNITYIPYYVSL